MTVIDAHLHVHDPDASLGDHELFEGFEAPYEDLIEDHEQEGVDGAVIIPMDANPVNLEYSSRADEQYPGESAIIGVYDDSVDDPAAWYRNILEDHDVQGLRVTSLNAEPDDSPRDLDIWPLLEEFADREHCLWMYPQVGEYGLVDEIAAELPDLKVVYNLLGCPHPGSIEYYEVDDRGLPRINRWNMPEEMPEESLDQLVASAERQNTYVLFGCHWQYSTEDFPYRDLVSHSQTIYEAFGAEHMAFITDWPWMRDYLGYDRLLELIDVHLPELSEDERTELTSGTIRRILDL